MNQLSLPTNDRLNVDKQNSTNIYFLSYFLKSQSRKFNLTVIYLWLFTFISQNS